MIVLVNLRGIHFAASASASALGSAALWTPPHASGMLPDSLKAMVIRLFWVD